MSEGHTSPTKSSQIIALIIGYSGDRKLIMQSSCAAVPNQMLLVTSAAVARIKSDDQIRIHRCDLIFNLIQKRHPASCLTFPSTNRLGCRIRRRYQPIGIIPLSQ